MSSPIWLSLAVVVILAVTYFLWSSSNNKPVVTPTTKFSSENVQVQNTNLATAAGSSKLPSGFPTDTPVELTGITESTTLTYPERKATLYSVSYLSDKQQQELFTIYGKYLVDSGYKIMNTDKSVAHMMYQATKGQNDFTVVITPQGKQMLVQVSYVVRQ